MSCSVVRTELTSFLQMLHLHTATACTQMSWTVTIVRFSRLAWQCEVCAPYPCLFKGQLSCSVSAASLHVAFVLTSPWTTACVQMMLWLRFSLWVNAVRLCFLKRNAVHHDAFYKHDGEHVMNRNTNQRLFEEGLLDTRLCHRSTVCLLNQSA